MPVIDAAGARLAYTECGAGEPVLALHSSASSSCQWKALGQAARGNFYVIAPDLCGYGDSDGWNGDGPLSLNEEARRVWRIIDRLVEPVHLIGHSYGGAVALRLALDKPHRIRSLTLIEPVAFQVLRHGGQRERQLFQEISGVAGSVVSMVEVPPPRQVATRKDSLGHLTRMSVADHRRVLFSFAPKSLFRVVIEMVLYPSGKQPYREYGYENYQWNKHKHCDW